jgi:hypothetical protein
VKKIPGVILGCLLATTSCYVSPDLDHEPARLLLSGACAAGTDRLVEVGSLRTQGPTRFGVLGLEGTGLPADIYFTRYPSHIREGAWFLAGPSCLAGDALTCATPEQFRLCTARRIDWQIALTCIDGLDRPVCTGVLREAPPR